MRFKAVKEVFVIEKVDEDPSEFPKQDKKAPSKYYENHLQKSADGYIRYCYGDVKLDGRKVYGEHALIQPESLCADLHLKALERGILNPQLWLDFAKEVLRRAKKQVTTNNQLFLSLDNKEATICQNPRLCI